MRDPPRTASRMPGRPLRRMSMAEPLARRTSMGRRPKTPRSKTPRSRRSLAGPLRFSQPKAIHTTHPAHPPRLDPSVSTQSTPSEPQAGGVRQIMDASHHAQPEAENSGAHAQPSGIDFRELAPEALDSQSEASTAAAAMPAGQLPATTTDDAAPAGQLPASNPARQLSKDSADLSRKRSRRASVSAGYPGMGHAAVRNKPHAAGRGNEKTSRRQRLSLMGSSEALNARPAVPGHRSAGEHEHRSAEAGCLPAMPMAVPSAFSSGES